jgi:hypothetical protein
VIEVPKGFVALDETLQNAFFKLTKHLLVWVEMSSCYLWIKLFEHL